MIYCIKKKQNAVSHESGMHIALNLIQYYSQGKHSLNRTETNQPNTNK